MDIASPARDRRVSFAKTAIIYFGNHNGTAPRKSVSVYPQGFGKEYGSEGSRKDVSYQERCKEKAQTF
jgi:hypothetical protein